MADGVRYKANGDNALLRFVLYDIWEYKCYWCGTPKDYNEIQIGHIIPQTVKHGQLQELLTRFSLPAEFEVHDPRNLAPICSSCNGRGEKGDQDLSDVPVVLTKLKKAEKLRSTVIERVRTFAVPGKTAGALILAIEADLSNPATRKAFEAHAPAVVQKLALLDEAKVDFVSFRTVEVRVDEDHERPDLKVGISLRASARRAATILEDVCGGVIEDVVWEPVIDLFQQIHDRVQSSFERVQGNFEDFSNDSDGLPNDAKGLLDDLDEFPADFEAIDYPVEPITAGPPVSDFMRIGIDSIDFTRNGPFFEFTFGGTSKPACQPPWCDTARMAANLRSFRATPS